MKSKFHYFIIFTILHSILTIPCSSAPYCNHSCGGQKLPFPFGFSSGCQIQLNCTANGTILAAEFPVQSIKAGTIVVNLPAMCHRPVAALGSLFTGSFAPTSHNGILLQDCRNASRGCLIPSTMVQTHFEQLDCDADNSTIGCYAEADNATSFIDYEDLTRSGCRSLFSSISMEDDMYSSSVSLDLQILRLGWWLRGDCRCSRNANCISVSAPRGGSSPPAYRCACIAGFAGDGFIDGEGCRKENHGGSREKKFVRFMVPSLILAIIFVIVVLVFIFKRKQKQVLLSADTSLIAEWRRISYIELNRGTNYFSETNLLGRGSFGSVYQATLFDGLKVAVKVFNLQVEKAMRSFDTECEILGNIRHRNLVRVIGCCSNTKFRSLILTYMPNGSLENWLYSNNFGLDLIQRLNIAIDDSSSDISSKDKKNCCSWYRKASLTPCLFC